MNLELFNTTELKLETKAVILPSVNGSASLLLLADTEEILLPGSC